MVSFNEPMATWSVKKKEKRRVERKAWGFSEETVTVLKDHREENHTD